MVRPKRGQQPALAAEPIKAVARKQMGEYGTAGLSLRGIARELNVTAPALYNYFPCLDDLITALIVDAFTDLAMAMEKACERTASPTSAPKIVAMLDAYREWALEHSVDFQLIYGNPIPGYAAPAEVTGPLAFRPFRGMFELFSQALQTGEMRLPPEYGEVPLSIARHLAEWKQHAGVNLPDVLVLLLMGGWARIHGLVMLELFNHLGPVVGDPGALYQYEIQALLERLR